MLQSLGDYNCWPSANLFTIEAVWFTPQASTEEEVITFLGDTFPKLTKDENEKIDEYYNDIKSQPPNAPFFSAVEQAWGEACLICPSISILEAIRDTSDQPAWSYRNNVYDDFYASIGFGTPHGWEEGAIFGPDNTNNPGRYTAPESLYDYNAPLVPVFMNYWISFVRSLSPNEHRSSESPEWETWNESQRKLLIELDNLHMESVGEAQVERCEFWEGIDRTLIE